MSGRTTDAETGRDVERLGRRRWLAAGGALLVFVGIVLALSGAVPADSAPGLGLVGGLALLAGVVLAVARLRGSGSVARAPAVERREGVESVGATFEERAQAATEADEQVRPAVRSAVRDRLRGLARDTLAAERDGDREAAVATLAEGSWTDDEVAGAFLGANIRARIEVSMPPFDERARRAVDALLTVVGDASGEQLQWAADDGGETNWRTGTRLTDHWRGFGALVLFAFAGAALTRTPGLVIVAATLLGVVGYVRVTRVPTAEVSLERTVDTDHPRPGETVEVTVTVTNEGEQVVPDLRVVDGVPPRLAVVGGAARHATALAPGGSTTFSYEVLAVYGEHEFATAHLAVRDASGRRERTETAETATHTLSCEPGVVRESVPLHPQATGITGRVPSDVGGSGQAFHSVREYRRGDSLRRVDWNRVARTGELSTVELHEEHAATVVVLVDARAVSSRAPDRHSLSALDRSLAGASQLFTTLSGDGDRVGLASIAADWLWLAPGGGNAHRARVRDALTGDGLEGRGGRRFQPGTYVRELRTRLPANAQLIVLSPLLDDGAVTVIRRLHAHGHAVTVFSPDPTTTATVGGAAAHLERRLNLGLLRGDGLRAVDWSADESLTRAVDRANRGWDA